MVKTFLSDKEDALGSLFSVRYSHVRFAGYDVQEIPHLERKHAINSDPLVEQNIKIVVGVGKTQKADNPPYPYPGNDDVHEIMLNKSVFFDVMSLTKNINIGAGFNEYNANLIPTADVLLLCKKYGFGLGLIDYDILKQHKKFAFPVKVFKYRLFSLHCRFAVYMAIYYDNYNLMRRLIPQNKGPRGISSNEQLLTIAKEWLATYTDPGPGIRFTLRPTAKGFGFEVDACGDIIHAADMILSFMIAGGDGRNIKICVNCGQFFTGHGNRKYCNNCNRKTVWSRKNRSKMDE